MSSNDSDPKSLHKEDPEAIAKGDLSEASIGMNTIVPGPTMDPMTPGLTAGAFTGAFAGNAVYDPVAEGEYWRDRHASEAYSAGEPYENYEAAYMAGYEGYGRHGGKSFAEVEDHIRKQYESQHPPLTWEKARHAAEAAWERLHKRLS